VEGGMRIRSLLFGPFILGSGLLTLELPAKNNDMTR